MKQKSRWNNIIEDLENILSAPDMDCECDDCVVARYILNLLDFPDNADDIDPDKIGKLNKIIE